MIKETSYDFNIINSFIINLRNEDGTPVDETKLIVTLVKFLEQNKLKTNESITICPQGLSYE